MASVIVKRTVNASLLASIGKLKNTSVKVGWFPSARYEDKHATPVAEVAAKNEFGYPAGNVPARPFMRPAIARNENKWAKTMASGAKSVIEGNTETSVLLDIFGAMVAGDIKDSIARVFEPPLSQVTINKRLERRNATTSRINKQQALSLTKPLIDTGLMLSTVSYEIGGVDE